MKLSRTVRFAVNAGQHGPAVGPNGYAGVPSIDSLGRHYELEITCAGTPDAQTGYFLDIKAIDRAARETIIPAIARACHASPGHDPATVLAANVEPLSEALGGRLDSVRWLLSPYYSIAMTRPQLDRAVLRQRFEFAAAHRLNVPSLSPEANRSLFGKCNNPSGHGHNYVLEPAVSIALNNPARVLPLSTFERLVRETVIDRFDHKNLNVDTPEFADGAGLNPSVENIARVCFELLAPQIASESGDARLESVTVWETEKTCATYPA